MSTCNPTRRKRVMRLPRRTRGEKIDHAEILRVIRLVADTCGVRPVDFIRQDRHTKIARARHLAIATVYHQFPGLVCEQIGELFHRDHAAVRCSIGSHARLLGRDAAYQAQHAQITIAVNYP
jgi:chromosomal replication initiation ATPase DnaA